MSASPDARSLAVGMNGFGSHRSFHRFSASSPNSTAALTTRATVDSDAASPSSSAHPAIAATEQAAAIAPSVIAGMYALNTAHCVAQPSAPTTVPHRNIQLQYRKPAAPAGSFLRDAANTPTAISAVTTTIVSAGN